MSDEQQPTLSALQQELIELEAALQSIQQTREAQAQAQLDALEHEKELYRQEQQELVRRQNLIIKRGQADPWYWIGSHFGMDDWQ